MIDVDNCNVDKLLSGHDFRGGFLADTVDNPVFKVAEDFSYGGEVDVSNGPFKPADTTEKIIFDDHFKPKSNRVSTVNRDLEGQMAGRATKNKYERMIEDRYGDSCHIDVYDVLKAFEVTCPATQHAIKKLLCTGLRGHKDRDTDLLEAKESIVRAIELNGEVK